MKNEYYFTGYLKNFIEEDILEHLKFTIDKSIYYYGDHFKSPYETKTKDYNEILKNYLKYIYKAYKSINSANNKLEPKIISNSYFKLDKELEKLGYKVISPPWVFKNTLVTYKAIRIINNVKTYLDKDLPDLISEKGIKLINELSEILKYFYLENNIKAAFFPYDLPLFESLSIKIMKNLDIKTFTFLHGLPGIYNNIENNKTDYMMVWGDSIKKNYINEGVDENKIFVTGHPIYQKIENINLVNSYDNILVLAKSCPGGQFGDYKSIICDRGNSILYLYSIYNVLKNLGIKKVRFRPHPSENINWYYKFIDKHFFEPDYEPLSESLSKSSLIIGPTSTVFLEAIHSGINYIVYEPSKNNVDVLNYNLYPPFDGSDQRLKVSKTEEELYENIKIKTLVNLDIFNDYIKTPFDIGFVKELI